MKNKNQGHHLRDQRIHPKNNSTREVQFCGLKILEPFARARMGKAKKVKSALTSMLSFRSTRSRSSSRASSSWANSEMEIDPLSPAV
jgi:hypothetical protein